IQYMMRFPLSPLGLARHASPVGLARHAVPDFDFQYLPMMAAPPPPPPPSPPVRVRTKFPESWIFTSFESGISDSVLPYVMRTRLTARRGMMAAVPDEVDFAVAERVSAPLPKSSRSSPIKIRKKFPERIHFKKVIGRLPLPGQPGPPGAVRLAAPMMTAPRRPPPPAPPIKVRTKFPESWIFISFESGNGRLVFVVNDFMGGAGFDFEGGPPMPNMPGDEMVMVRAFSDSGAPAPVKIRTEFPESWIVVSINTEYV
ncbi:hypothetical protein ANCCEY_14923, partial [Ancylostoma ceylanicum]